MNSLLHHFKKDLRHTRWWILLTLLVSAGVLGFSVIPIDERGKASEWLMLFRYGGWVLLVPTIGRLMLRDAPLRDTGFLNTRPVFLTVLLGAKGLVVLSLIVPMALCECAMILILGLRPGIGDLFLIFAENLLVLTAIAAVTAAMILREKSAAGFQTSAILWCLIAFLSWIAWAWISERALRQQKVEWSYSLEYLKLSRLLIAQLVAATGALIGIVLFIRSRRGATVSTALAVTAVCAIAAWFFWPVNFVEAMTPPQREAAKSEWPDLSKLKFSFTEQPGWSRNKSEPVMTRFSFSDGGYNDTTYRGIRTHTRLEGLPSGWFAFPNSYRSDLTFSNGRTVPSKFDSWGDLDEKIALPLVGIPSPWNYDTLSHVALAEFRLPDAAGVMTGAKLKGVIEVPLKRPVILARMPLRKGASLRIDGRLLQITRAQRLDDKIDFNLVMETPIIFSRGGWSAGPDPRLQTLVVHPARREFLTNGSSGSSGKGIGHYGLQNLDFSQTLWRDPMTKQEDRTIPDGWMDGAELLILGRESGGTFSQSFEFSDVTLSNDS